MVYIKRVLTKIWDTIAWPYRKVKENIEFRKRMKELRKRDPFIYR